MQLFFLFRHLCEIRRLKSDTRIGIVPGSHILLLREDHVCMAVEVGGKIPDLLPLRKSCA
jgi:hypothetical protein